MCPGERDARDCEDVCAQLRIPLHRVSFEKEYWQLVFQRMLSGMSRVRSCGRVGAWALGRGPLMLARQAEYARGVTPNPDALCNREIKFSLFLDFAFGTLGADLVATGHYARLR
jgi:tRNA-specific 2-thiouridylase